MEIHPYSLARRLTGAWNSTVMTSTFVALHLLVCLIFLWTFLGVRRRYLVPFFPLFLFAEIITSSAMTFFVTALILFVVRKDQAGTRPAYRFLIAALFGVGLMTKFLVIPLMAGYYGSKIDWKRPATLLRILPDAALALAVAALIMVPFGVAAVLRETILFNLILKDRAALTTFFPNVLSGPMSLGRAGRPLPRRRPGPARGRGRGRVEARPGSGDDGRDVHVPVRGRDTRAAIPAGAALPGAVRDLREAGGDRTLRQAPAGGEPAGRRGGRRPGPRAQSRQVTPRA